MPEDRPSDRSVRPVVPVRAYYHAIDDDEYDLLAELLAPEFTHHRPDMTIESRDEFVRFMREERPMTDTSHPVDAVYEQVDGDEVVVRGRLLDADGGLLTRFVDVFAVEGATLTGLRTFTD